MTMFVLQAVFLIAVAFGLGCLVGCILKGRSGSAQPHPGAAGAVTHEGAAHAVTAGELAAQSPHYEPETSPQPASALVPKPEPTEENTTPAAAAPATAASAKKATTPKTAKPKAAKSAVSKSSAPKAAASKPKPKPKATASDAAKVMVEKPVTAKAAAAKTKATKTKPAASATPDNLKQIKGVGPQIEAKLNAAGINSFAQIAAWTKKEQAQFAEQLSFAGRIEREEWVSQAKILAKGGSTDFAKRVAKGEVATSAGSKPKRGAKK
ncbi:hypothetical protein WNZ14_10300 [Hoeflea sp. AS60]|uniref:hypothetical protein n=1 Tax=Hoeflea sp. AS60 TaxID=3135780 RepID=UPI00316C78F5